MVLAKARIPELRKVFAEEVKARVGVEGVGLGVGVGEGGAVRVGVGAGAGGSRRVLLREEARREEKE